MTEVNTIMMYCCQHCSYICFLLGETVGRWTGTEMLQDYGNQVILFYTILLNFIFHCLRKQTHEK